MRKMSTLIPLFLFVVITLVGVKDSYADTFASNIRLTQPNDASKPFDGKLDDGTGVGIRFVLCDVADSVVVTIKSGSTVVRTMKNTNFIAGDTVVVWDGKDDAGKYVATGSYKVSVYTMNGGNFEYTQLSSTGVAISTRGVTCITNPALKNFGFVYAASSGSGYPTGAARHAADLSFWGDTKGDATLTTTGIALGTANARYSSEADNEGYIYVIGRDNRQILRYHSDTLNVKVIDSTGYAGWYLNSIAIRELNGGKFIAVAANNSSSAAGTDSKVFGFEIGNNASYFGAKSDVLVGDSTIIFWDVTFGRDNLMYVTFFGKSDNLRTGIAAFNYTGTTLHMKDTLWTSTVAAGRGNTCCYYKGATADKDVLYFSIARRCSGDTQATQNIYAVSNLTTTKDQVIAYVDPENNMTQYRSDITVDAIGNIIFFENSNEEIALIAPPNGVNHFTTPGYDPIVITSSPLSVKSTGVVADKFALSQNYPNPFNPTTTIKFSLANQSTVDLKVYNTLGQEVAVLINKQTYNKGSYECSFDASKLASGTYIYRLQAGNFVSTKKMVLVK